MKDHIKQLLDEANAAYAEWKRLAVMDDTNDSLARIRHNQAMEVARVRRYETEKALAAAVGAVDAALARDAKIDGNQEARYERDTNGRRIGRLDEEAESGARE